MKKSIIVLIAIIAVVLSLLIWQQRTSSNLFQFMYPLGGEHFTSDQRVNIKWSTGAINSNHGAILNLISNAKIISIEGVQGITGKQVDFSSERVLWTVPQLATGQYQLKLHVVSSGDPGILIGEIVSGVFTIN